MFEIKITIDAPELADAMRRLADALVQEPRPAPAPVPLPEPTPEPDPAPTPAPPPEPASLDPGKEITVDDLARCGAALVDEGKMEELVALLGQYGVQAITQLKPEQFAGFAADLCKLGGVMEG